MKPVTYSAAYFRRTGAKGARTTHARYSPAQRSAQIKRGIAAKKRNGK